MRQDIGKRVEQELTLRAARQPRTPDGELMLKAAEVIYKLRAELKYHKDVLAANTDNGAGHEHAS